jgi:hypothetical protein
MAKLFLISDLFLRLPSDVHPGDQREIAQYVADTLGKSKKETFIFQHHETHTLKQKVVLSGLPAKFVGGTVFRFRCAQRLRKSRAKQGPLSKLRAPKASRTRYDRKGEVSVYFPALKDNFVIGKVPGNVGLRFVRASHVGFGELSSLKKFKVGSKTIPALCTQQDEEI